MVTALIIGALAIGVVGWTWRINLALNHPEKEERLRKLGKHIWEEQAEVAEKLTAKAKESTGRSKGRPFLKGIRQ